MLVRRVNAQSQPWTANTGALFLGFENLVLGAGGGQAGSGPIPQSAVSWLCRGFGNTAIRHAGRLPLVKRRCRWLGINLQRLGVGSAVRRSIEDVAVAPLDLFEEGQEVLMTVPGLSYRGHCPVAMSRAAKRVVVPCR